MCRCLCAPLRCKPVIPISRLIPTFIARKDFAKLRSDEAIPQLMGKHLACEIASACPERSRRVAQPPPANDRWLSAAIRPHPFLPPRGEGDMVGKIEAYLTTGGFLHQGCSQSPLPLRGEGLGWGCTGSACHWIMLEVQPYDPSQ